ncbi:MAG: hypothetical protein AAFX02_01290 [Pseudomonadota bacterium]
MLDILVKRRLLIFVTLLVLAVFATAKSLPAMLFNLSLAGNQGVGYSAVVSALDEAGTYVDEQTEPGSTDRAEGYRYALRRIDAFMPVFFTEANPAAPTIDRCPSNLCKYGFDNPDTAYVSIGPIGPGFTYKITGQLGTTPYNTFQLFQMGPEGFQTGGTLELSEMQIDESGTFELWLGTENTSGHVNFMQMRPSGFGQLIIRQLHYDWETESEMQLRVEAIPDETGSSPSTDILTMEMMDRRATGFALFIRSNMKTYREIIRDAPVNALPKAGAGVDDGAFPTNFTSTMRYEVSPGEAVLIEIPQMDLVYGNIQMGNLWGESLDYVTRTTSFNRFQSHLDSDRVYRYVIATEDPGVPNWLDATGHPAGGIFARWQSPAGELAEPKTTRMTIDELRDALPADHPLVTPAERIEQIQARVRGYNRRKNPVY